MTGSSVRLVACHCCGLVQQAPSLPPGARARCARCESVVLDPAKRARGVGRCASAALAALLLYPFAVGLPIMTIERFGHAREASIWTGTWELLARGEWFVGVIVLACSIVVPLLKLVGLLSITLGGRALSRRWRAFTYRVIEWAGRWGMLDVLLIAVIVAWVKVGDLVEVTPGPAAVTFTSMVVLSLLASTWFDPHAIWETDDPLELSR
jgi:paraquat-inducible protein A